MKLCVPVSAICLLAAVGFGQSYIGRVDTIGGTTYDWQTSGPVARWLVNAPGCGLHAVWMFSAEANTVFNDRNLRYNYYDFATRQWGWIDPEHISSGHNVFTHRAGYGNVDYDPRTGVAVIGGHYTGAGGGTTKLARDVAPGSGMFEYADGSGQDMRGWPRLAVSEDGTIHVLCMSAAYMMSYSRILPQRWPDFEPPMPIGPSPGFPTYNVAAAKVSGRVCLIWAMAVHQPMYGYLQTSSDHGASWTDTIRFLPPEAYGGDTLTSFTASALFPSYDSQDRLHVVASVVPMLYDTLYVAPTQIWHWCADNTPPWSRIHVASCRPQNLHGRLGYSAVYADRPSIGEGSDGRLYVAWEQFDSSNVEPLTERLRAGVWVSGSADNGVSWTPGMLVTERNTYSHRFPCVADRTVSGGPSQDTVCVLYMMDSVAGFFVQNEGPATRNPVVCQFITTSKVGSQDRDQTQAPGGKPQATIVRALPSDAVAFDVTGRRVLSPKPGVYFVAEGVGARGQGLGRIRKVIVQR